MYTNYIKSSLKDEAKIKRQSIQFGTGPLLEENSPKQELESVNESSQPTVERTRNQRIDNNRRIKNWQDF